MTDKPLNLALYLVLDPDLCSQSVGIVETALAAVQAGAALCSCGHQPGKSAV